MKTALYIVPFIIVSALLILTRMPWIDEPWFAGGASALLVEGQALDLGFCMWSDRPHYFYLGALFSAIQAIWYTLTSFDLISGRSLSVIASIGTLFFLNDITASLGVDTKWRRASILIISGNYYFLVCATQLRPEAFAVICITASLAAYLKWQREPARSGLLLTANISATFAGLFHLQAGFSAIFMLLCLLLIDARILTARHLRYLGLYYTALLLLFGFHYFSHMEQWHSYLPEAFGNNLNNHGGGFLSAAKYYIGTGQWKKLTLHASTVLFTAAGLAVYWKQRGSNRQVRVAVFYALGGYVSWVLTTIFIGDYHSIWLMIAFFLLSSFSLERLFSRSPLPDKLLSLALIALLCFYFVYGVSYAAGVITSNPRKNLYENELETFDRRHDLSGSTVTGPRDIMLYFNYDREILCWEAHKGEPEYYLAYAHDMNAAKKMASKGYLQIEKGKAFSLFRKVEPADTISSDLYRYTLPSP